MLHLRCFLVFNCIVFFFAKRLTHNVCTYNVIAVPRFRKGNHRRERKETAFTLVQIPVEIKTQFEYEKQKYHSYIVSFFVIIPKHLKERKTFQ